MLDAPQNVLDGHPYWEKCPKCKGTGKLFYAPFSVDISGRWSGRQAKKIIDVLEWEAKERGVKFELLNITTQSDPGKRYIIQVYCARHDRPVLQDSACDECQRAGE